MFTVWQGNQTGLFLSTAALVFVSTGCAQHGEEAKSPIGITSGSDATLLELEAKDKEEAEKLSPTIVRDSARPFSGFRQADGLEMGEEELLTYLASADAVCIGERHDNALDHYAQLRTIEGFLERRPMRGFELGLGLEMIPAPQQETLDSYSIGRFETADLPGLLSWERVWGFPFDLYRAQIEAGASAGGDLLALGVDRAITRKIATSGIESLEPEDRNRLPELDRGNARHRALFESLMEGHPAPPEGLDNYYDAQLVWDESMAESAADWLLARQPGRKLIILAGTAHCHKSGIVQRLAWRTGLYVTNLLIVDSGQAKRKPQEDGSADEQIASGYDYQMVFRK